MAKTSKGYFRFQKVDNFFTSDAGWNAVTSMTECKWDADGRILTAHLETDCPDRQNCDLLVQVVTGSIIRVRFHPSMREADYSNYNTRAIVQDTFSDLLKINTAKEFSAVFSTADKQYAELRFHGSRTDRLIILRVWYKPFRLEVLRQSSEGGLYKVLAAKELRFAPTGGLDDYSVIQTQEKPSTARYVGFGEQGGLSLMKNN